MEHWGRLAVFDLETTGVDIDTARIVSACVAVLGSTGDVLARWDWLADPGVEIPEGASAVHGITTERARAEGRPATLVVAELASTLRVLFGTGIPVVVYNAPYDLSLLDRECRRHEVEPIEQPGPVIDPLVIDKALDRYRKGKRTLTVTAERYGVRLDDAHDASADAIAAGRVAQALARAFPEELDIPAADLHGRQEVWYAEQAASFQDYIRRVKGDESYFANPQWPVRVAEEPGLFQDTLPLPPPPPRPSETVPFVDIYRPGLFALEAGAPRTQAVAYGPPPSAPRALGPVRTSPAPPRPSRGGRTAVLRLASAIITDAAGRALVVRRRGGEDFSSAGGSIRAGESALDALVRALREQLGIELDPDRTEYVGSYRVTEVEPPERVIRTEVFAISADSDRYLPGAEVDELLWLEGVDAGVRLSALMREAIVPLWIERRSALF